MNTVILDDDLKSRLNGLDQHLEVRDPAGKLVGHFLPDALYMRMLYDWARAEFAREEAEEAAKRPRRPRRASSASGTAPTAERRRRRSHL